MRIAGALLCASVLAGSLALGWAQAQAQTPPSSGPLPKWGPFIDLGGEVGTERNIGESDLFVPLLQNGSSMLFTDIRGRFDDRDSQEGNFGLGVRHILASGWNLGAYGYYDRLKSALGNDFGQATFGGEALSLNWDARANFYQPVGPRIANLGSTSSSTAAISGTSVEVTTTGTHSQEVAMQGFDGEIGWRVPIFGPASTTQLRVYGGGYDFHASGVPSIAGPRGRLDLTMDRVPHLWRGARLDLGAEVQHDGPRGTQAFALVSLRIPLQIFASAAPSTLAPMERRMEDPIVRDVDVVSETRTEATPTIVETATETASGSQITVLSSASTTGAALPGAVAIAGANSTIILSGSFTTSASLTLQSGQTVMGAGSLAVKAPSGRTATLTTPSATVTGNLGGTNYTVTMVNNSTLSGMVINTTDNSIANALAVQANGVSGAKIIDNTINATQNGTGTAHGVDVTGGASNITVSGNTITARGSGGASDAIGVQVNNSSATVTGNSLSASGGVTTNATVLLSSANILSGSNDNKAVAGSCDVAAAGTGTTVNFTNAAPCGP
ncbi:MAG: inverse autotransporter beta domain-containing protein [Stellaceae bacterium]